MDNKIVAAAVLVVVLLIVLSTVLPGAPLYQDKTPYRSNYTLAIRYSTLVPETLTVPIGSTVIIKNEDGVVYNLEVTGPMNTTIENLGGGQQYQFTNAAAGTYFIRETRYGLQGNFSVT